MPTAARLVAAIGFGIIAFMASEFFEVLLPEGTRTVYFAEGNVIFGLFAGWRGIGREVGRGPSAAITQGLITTIAMVFYALLFHSLYQMIQNAFDMKYNDAAGAVIGVFELAVEFSTMMAQSVPLMVTLLVGGAVVSLCAEWANARWK